MTMRTRRADPRRSTTPRRARALLAIAAAGFPAGVAFIGCYDWTVADVSTSPDADAALEAALDAGPETDAAPEASPDPLACPGGAVCSGAGAVCCGDAGVFACAPSTGCDGVVFACTRASHCPGQHCCIDKRPSDGTVFSACGECAPNQRMCVDAADCDGGVCDGTDVNVGAKVTVCR